MTSWMFKKWICVYQQDILPKCRAEFSKSYRKKAFVDQHKDWAPCCGLYSFQVHTTSAAFKCLCINYINSIAIKLEIACVKKNCDHESSAYQQDQTIKDSSNTRREILECWEDVRQIQQTNNSLANLLTPHSQRVVQAGFSWVCKCV